MYYNFIACCVHPNIVCIPTRNLYNNIIDDKISKKYNLKFDRISAGVFLNCMHYLL